MTAARTVTVPTLDHGPVTLPEPAWCTGAMHQDGGYRVDITHTSPSVEFTVPTSRGDVVLLRIGMEQRPFTEQPPGRDAFVTVEIDGDWYPSDLAAVDRLAAALVEVASALQATARQFTAVIAGGEGR